MQQCSLRGLKVPEGPSLVTDQPMVGDLINFCNLNMRLMTTKQVLNRNYLMTKKQNDLTRNILKVKEYLDPGRDS